MLMESDGGGEDNEVHDEIGKGGTRAHIQLAIDDLLARCVSSLHDHSPAHCFLGFHLLRGLPEKEIRTDGCAKNGDEGLPGRVIFRPGRHERIMHGPAPIGLHYEGCNDVSEQAKSQPFQDRGDLVITAAHCPECDSNAEYEDKQMRIKSAQHLGCVSHSEKIRADVDGVGAEECKRGKNKHPARNFLS